ncbi:hypothetical protein ACFZAV_39650 [Streptomyces sp. NPDC008343]|uniref:hypothetical protein n=1 Tax=Streptomyces sp. NPDC008343 TaxID=3364828 RepID=UPI0036DFD8C7
MTRPLPVVPPIPVTLVERLMRLGMQAVLFVYAKGGPPLEYVVPRMAAHARVHLLALTEIPYTRAVTWQSSVASVRHVTVEYETDLADLIAHRAMEVQAGAVLTFSESAVAAVAEACTVLGCGRRRQRCQGE